MKFLRDVVDVHMVQRLGRALVARGAKRRAPRMVALGWVLLTRRLRVPGLRPRRTYGRRVVVLSKLGGVEDVVATFAGRGKLDVGVLRLARGDVKTVYHAFISADLEDFDYRPGDPELADAKHAYRVFMGHVVQHYRRWLGVGAMVAANISYFAERELAAGCTDVGLPFLALHKESIRTTLQRRIYEEVLRQHIGPFEGAAVAVYNEAEQASQIAAQVVAPDRITVVGCARADVLHAERGRPPDAARPLVVYFAIDPQAGTRQFHPQSDPEVVGDDGRPLRPLRWDEVARRTEAALVALARSRPDIDVVVKVKLGRWRITSERFADVDVPGNLRIVHGGLATKWLRAATTVVGLNTTSLVEAIVAGRHVIVPGFDEADPDQAGGYLLALDSCAEVATSPDDLAKRVAASLSRPCAATLSAGAVTVVTRYLGDAEGKAGDRTFSWMVGHLPRR